MISVGLPMLAADSISQSSWFSWFFHGSFMDVHALFMDLLCVFHGHPWRRGVQKLPWLLGWLLSLLVAAMVGDLPKQGQHTGVDLTT